MRKSITIDAGPGKPRRAFTPGAHGFRRFVAQVYLGQIPRPLGTAAERGISVTYHPRIDLGFPEHLREYFENKGRADKERRSRGGMM